VFWVLRVSCSDSTRGLSMPMKTVVKLASRNSASSSSSCAGVQRDLCVEVHRVAPLAAPARDRAQQILGELLVADEVVVDDEDLLGAEPVALLDLGHHLVHLLGARAPAVDDDDVAELALEGTAARELDRHGVIAIDVQQVEARHRRQREVGLLVGAVLALPGARREVAQEDGPGLFGFVTKSTSQQPRHCSDTAKRAGRPPPRSDRGAGTRR